MQNRLKVTMKTSDRTYILFGILIFNTYGIAGPAGADMKSLIESAKTVKPFPTEDILRKRNSINKN